MIRWICLAAILLGYSARAEDFNPSAQACMSKLLETTQRDIEVRTEAFTLQHDLIAARAHIKELEDKYEPKKPDEPK